MARPARPKDSYKGVKYTTAGLFVCKCGKVMVQGTNPKAKEPIPDYDKCTFTTYSSWKGGFLTTAVWHCPKWCHWGDPRCRRIYLEQVDGVKKIVGLPVEHPMPQTPRKIQKSMEGYLTPSTSGKGNRQRKVDNLKSPGGRSGNHEGMSIS